MDPDTRSIIDECVAASHAGTGNFGEIVLKLAARGVESYRVDFRERASTYYAPSGEPYRVRVHTPDESIASDFDSAEIQAAIRGSQQGLVKYPEFMRRAVQAGCTGYTVWIAGRKVSYHGRRGETHTEHFPS